jgi:pyridoxal phosphate enzyme (YggS family)
MTDDLPTRLADVKHRIAEALRDAGRPPDAAQLIAVSKTHPVERLREALDVGQVHFGESYAQELRDKAPLLPDAVKWHFIGRIQSNKIKYIAPRAYRVHGVTKVAHAAALAKKRPGAAPLKVLINVDVGDEASKVGVAPDAVPDLCDGIARVEGVSLVGMMCIPPPTDTPEEAGPYFARLAELAESARGRGHATTELSMGMTADFEVALQHGATWIRVGTAIFGPRLRT